MSHYVAPEADDRALADMADALLTKREVRWACPFCLKELHDERAACCGEVGHAMPLPDDWED